MSTPHLTELLTLTDALDAALLGMTTAELKATGEPAPAATAAALIANLSAVELRDARAAVLPAVYPAARVIAEQAYARAWQRARTLVDEHTGDPDVILGTLDQPGDDIPPDMDIELNPFAEGAVTV